MSETRDFLFEIGAEELPPLSLLPLSTALSAHIESGLRKAGLLHGTVHTYATPRRLAVLVEQLEVCQPEQTIERRGPARNAAYQADGTPSKALEGFLKSCHATLDETYTLTMGKGEWVAVRHTLPGAKTADIIPGIVHQALLELPIAKRMRWGNGIAEFVRPVHWVVLLLGNEVIDANILGIQTGRETRGHRIHGEGNLSLQHPKEYAECLFKHYVMADFHMRREKIRLLTEEAAASVGGYAYVEGALLDEVTALVEWPVPVIGSFTSRYLSLPPEVLITTLQSHQKYFPVKNAQGGLLPYFITFSNLNSTYPETVKSGNERVVRPRLTDAEFFWNQDRKRTLASRVDELAGITFQKSLGSVRDKSRRVQHLAATIAEKLGEEKALAERAAYLAKADLLTNMVGEFPELQGIMGRYYALAEGEPETVAWAIEEQYLPKVSGGPLPDTRIGLILALAEKIDTLTGIFSAGLIPTGDKDPYALRRAALGVIRLFIEAELDMDVPDILDYALAQFHHPFDKEKTREQIHHFVLERLRGYFLDRGCAQDEFEAVLSIWPVSLLDFERRIYAVQVFRRLPEAESVTSANKRIRNLLRRSGEEIVANVDHTVLIEQAEMNLFEAARVSKADILPLLEERRYTEALCRLAQIRETVDTFFDKVMVIVDDPVLRQNRLGLLAIIEGLFLDIADVAKLQS